MGTIKFTECMGFICVVNCIFVISGPSRLAQFLSHHIFGVLEVCVLTMVSYTLIEFFSFSSLC
jgi:hypothetical protein